MSPNTHKLHIARKIIRIIMKFIHEHGAYIYYIPGTKNLADLFSRSPLLTSYLSNHPWILDCMNITEIRKDEKMPIHILFHIQLSLHKIQ